jgi:hypothetical protein
MSFGMTTPQSNLQAKRFIFAIAVSMVLPSKIFANPLRLCVFA